ncbi:hypothetical protein TWF225_005875 [Orbilia oligospora]|uniref:Uncharacterized protein n=1 Tax=Orbilia oligospora TaxID=2813651 RepID=A0A7C8KA08_ORBOL|nr:hypothetical protein TWF751_003813 [Orbilia oligospora]KAF3184575.1 hypothetical protein TWF225_005875 [Orbilia oligospora]KAF3237732.1 hypothetical protein TWF217_002054 [Orbilia oligospora]KAF3240919.1 hypothetical protein TWF128_011146 [Orbilia oligospora]KAF3288180.1 hypothetical protein TWF132_008000 [Orbilia oligospora]
METSPLKKKGASPSLAIESWDDDDDFKDVGDLRMSKPSSRFSDRGSTPSRLSVASDTLHDLAFMDDMEKDFVLPHLASIISPEDAIRSANKAGIPLPKDIPASALTGGSIRKIGASSKRVVKVDWTEDLEIDTSVPKFLTVKKVRSSEFPLDAFQTSSEDERSQFHDEDDIPTIRAHKRSPRRSPLIDAFRLPTPEIPSEQELAAKLPPPTDPFDAFDAIDDLPTDLPVVPSSERKSEIQANLSNFMDSDTDELAEGSLGTRHGGRYRSNSIMSTMSPSLASTFTVESEDESFNCIELPQADFDFQHALEEKRKSRLLARTASDLRNAGEQSKDDFLDDIEIGEGGLLSSKINRNKNILLKATPTSPRRSAVTLTFTRIGEQKMKKSHARRLSISSNHSTLESVDEGTPGRPASLEISIESQKGDNQKRPQPTLKRTDPSKQSRLLRPQRSTPNLKAQNSAPMKLPQALPPPVPPIPRSFFTENDTIPTIPTMLPVRAGYKGLPINRPPSRTMPNRPPSRNNSRAASRSSNRSESRGPPPKSPSAEQSHSINRYMNTSRPSSRASIGSRSKSPGRPSTPSQRPPFLPAGASQSQSQHVLSKLQRKSSAKALRPPSAQDSRPPSRSSRIRERSPLRNAQPAAVTTSPLSASGVIAPEPLRKEAASTNFMLAPVKKRHYGIGNELDAFDDLPTSLKLESKFTVKPVGQGAPRALRSTKRATLNTVAPPEGTLPVKETKLPRSNRRLITPPSAQRGALPLVGEIEQKRPSWRTKAPKRLNHDMPQRPQLITAATLPNQAKAVNDMVYNPTTFRWEGNEHAVRGFEKEEFLPTALPRPALISSVKSSKNIQVVGKMVFDPNHMCWLKVDDTGSDDEANALADIDDLKDTNSMTERSTRDSAHGASLNDLMTAEEFDVGPEFTRRQREEEQRWRRKVSGWISSNDARDPNRSWELRDIALSKTDSDYN